MNYLESLLMQSPFRGSVRETRHLTTDIIGQGSKKGGQHFHRNVAAGKPRAGSGDTEGSSLLDNCKRE